MNRKKKSTESITAYMRVIERLVGKLNVHVDQRDHFICNVFLHGLPNDILLYLGPPQNIFPQLYSKKQFNMKKF